MDLLGQIVVHRSFGEGKVTKQENNYVTIQFTKGEKTFLYPSSFQNFLSVNDKQTNNKIHAEINVLEQQKKVKEDERNHLTEIQRQHEMESSRSQSLANSRRKKLYSRSNIAFKCNYCDGGQSNYQVGFNGVCSDSAIHNNIKIEKRTWCCSDECACGQYLNDEINRKELDSLCDGGSFVCYESQMLRDWKALAGIVQRGEKKGQPMKLSFRLKKLILCCCGTITQMKINLKLQYGVQDFIGILMMNKQLKYLRIFQ